MNTAEDLARSYEWCYRVARDSGSSFYWAFWLLDRPQRNAMFALYAFARITDDLSDGANDHRTAAARDEQLDAWRRLLDHRVLLGVHGSVARHAHTPILPADETLSRYDLLWPALRHTVKKYNVPVELLQDLVTGVAMDVRPVRLELWSDVDRYCYHVASTVGLACTHIWQAADSLPLQEAIDCGLAFQLTNILRDLREDAARDRIYLPMEELRKFNCDPQAWLNGAPSGDWLGLVDGTIERSHHLYASGAKTVDHLPARGARMFALMWCHYRQLLETIARHKAHLWTGRPICLTRWQRLRLLIKTVSTPPKSARLWRD